MITGKQRSNLKAVANKLKPIMQIGKGGLSDTLVSQVNEHLFHNELIKIKVLDNAEFGAKDIISDLAKQSGAEPVSAIGNIITLYKYSNKENITHIKF